MTLTRPDPRFAEWIVSEMNRRAFNLVVQSEFIPTRGIGFDGQPTVSTELLLTVNDVLAAKRILHKMPLPRSRPFIRLQSVEIGTNPVYGRNLYSGLDELGSGANLLQALFLPNQGEHLANWAERQGETDATVNEGVARGAAARMEGAANADATRKEAKGNALVKRGETAKVFEERRGIGRGEMTKGRGLSDKAILQARGESQASRIEGRKAAVAAQIKARKDARRASLAARDEDAFLARKEAVERDLRQHGEMVALRAQAPIDRREEARKRASSERIQIAKDHIDERGTLATNRQVGRIERHASRLAEGSATQKSFLDFLETNRAARSTALQDAITSGLKEVLTGRKDRVEAKETGRTDRLAAKETGRTDRLAAKETGRTDRLAAKETGIQDRLVVQGTAKEGRITERKRAEASWSAARKGVKESPPTQEQGFDAWIDTLAPPESRPDEQIAGLGLFSSTDRFGASPMPIFSDHIEQFGADPEFDAVPLVKAALVKAKKGALPDPATWTDGVRGTALPLVKSVRDWVVENIVIPAEAREWDSIILASAAANGGRLKSEIKRYSDDDIATLNRVIHRVLA